MRSTPLPIRSVADRRQRRETQQSISVGVGTLPIEPAKQLMYNACINMRVKSNPPWPWGYLAAS
eukprot:337721-Pyramimonas_sp.AAC.1